MSTVDETGLAGEPPEGGLTTEPRKRFTDSAAFAWLQRFGKSLMLPIAALPAAALLIGVVATFFFVRPAHQTVPPQVVDPYAVGADAGRSESVPGSTA